LRKNGGRYEIVSGERRFRAFRHLRRDSVPCVVKAGVSDNEMLELALVENIQREQLNEIETAIAYQKLQQQCGYTHEQLAKQVGKSRAAITNSLRLLNLPGEIQQMLRKNELSAGHARALLSLDTPEKQLEAARRIAEGKLSVRDAEQFSRQEKSPPEAAPAPQKSAAEKPPQDPNIAHQLERLQYKFGTSVKLKETGINKGRIEIEYFSSEDILRIFDLLLDNQGLSGLGLMDDESAM
jgi:ParB family chromosome partitioning protein